MRIPEFQAAEIAGVINRSTIMRSGATSEMISLKESYTSMKPGPSQPIKKEHISRIVAIVFEVLSGLAKAGVGKGQP